MFLKDHSSQGVGPQSSKSLNFADQMYNMHKVWIGPHWIKQPTFLFFYCSGMFVGFAVYIVSVSHSCIFYRHFF